MKMTGSKTSGIYRGWIQPYNKNEYDELRDMGVFGPMLYKDYHITECYCEAKALEKVKEKYPSPRRHSYDFEKISEDELSKVRSSYFDRVATNGDPDYDGGKFWNHQGSRCNHVVKCLDGKSFITALYLDDLPEIGDMLFLHGPTCQLYREKKWSMIQTLLRGGLVSIYKVMGIEKDIKVEWENEYNANIELQFRARLDK